jgi:hypothetical protein
MCLSLTHFPSIPAALAGSAAALRISIETIDCFIREISPGAQTQRRRRKVAKRRHNAGSLRFLALLSHFDRLPCYRLSESGVKYC